MKNATTKTREDLDYFIGIVENKQKTTSFDPFIRIPIRNEYETHKISPAASGWFDNSMVNNVDTVASNSAKDINISPEQTSPTGEIYGEINLLSSWLVFTRLTVLRYYILSHPLIHKI